MEGSGYELLEKFMTSLEVQKEELSKELKEKEKIIEAQKRELSQKQRVIDKQEKVVGNLKVQKQKVKEIDTYRMIKQRQIKLITCSKKVLNAGANVAETSLRYLYALLMINNTEDRHEEQAITYDSPSQGKTVTEVVDVFSIRNVDHEKIVACEKEWEKQTADEVLTELEEALNTDNYNAMKEQQTRYSLVSSEVHQFQFQKMIKSMEDFKKIVESTYSKICIPPKAKQENVEYLVEIIVRFAIALNSFLEAICSSYEEGFDLSLLMLLSIKHPVYIVLGKLLKVVMDMLEKAGQWIQRKCRLQ